MTVTVTEVELALAFTEWDRRFREEPERFYSEAERLLKGTPGSYGAACAPYLLSILAERKDRRPGEPMAEAEAPTAREKSEFDAMGPPAWVQPTPTNFAMGQVPMPDGKLAVMLQATTASGLQATTASGLQVYFLSPADARRIGVELQKLGSANQLLVADGSVSSGGTGG